LLGHADLGYGLRVRIDAMWDLISFTLWPVGLAVCAASMAWLMRSRRDSLDRGLWGRTHLRAAWIAAATASIGAAAGIRGGLITATIIVGTGATVTVATLIAPDR
jgi:hypothetical protein